MIPYNTKMSRMYCCPFYNSLPVFSEYFNWIYLQGIDLESASKYMYIYIVISNTSISTDTLR